MGTGTLQEEITRYASEISLRFHTPGHMGRLDSRDLTEIEGGFPYDCVKVAERKAADAFGVKAVRFSVGGSSMCVKAAILACGKPILAEDICHRSVAEGCALARVPLYTFSRKSRDGLTIPPTTEEVLEAIEKHPDVGAVVLTSPDYYGRCINFDVFEAVKKRGVTLIVDSAHGAHFAFSPLFPPSPCKIADYCNMSAHKTLHAYTQTAYLAVNVDTKKVDRALELLGTTSPSYRLLESLETAIGYAQTADYGKVKREVEQIVNAHAFAANDDFTRLVLDARPFGCDGHTLYKRLLRRGVAAEKSDAGYVVFIVTPDNADGLRRLDGILCDLQKESR